jgi:hypothetical protein
VLQHTLEISSPARLCVEFVPVDSTDVALELGRPNDNVSVRIANANEICGHGIDDGLIDVVVLDNFFATLGLENVTWKVQHQRTPNVTCSVQCEPGASVMFA